MEQDDHDRYALPDGYRLNDYCIRRVLGQGGFGITYLARDERLDRDVAVKEFMPGDLVMRQGDSRIMPRSTMATQDYQGGLERFLKEARTLARFSHPNIVRVLTLFEANGTAYMVMSYEAGESLDQRLKARGGPLPAAELLAIAGPLLDGLAAVHEAGFLHRDIKPSNIFLRHDGSPVLLDFGTARQITGHASRSITAVLTPGYAPIEQYHLQGDQREWTDIYGMGAVLYSCISGRVPPDAPARGQALMDRQPDPLKPAKLVGQGRYPVRFLAAIDAALAVRPKDRLHSVAELRQALIADERRGGDDRSGQSSERSWLVRRWPVLMAGGGGALLAAAVALVLLGPPPPPASAPTPAQSSLTSALEDEAELSAAREAIQVSTVYGRQTYRRTRQREALASLEHLAQIDTRYQKQLDEVQRGLQSLDRDTDSLLHQYAGLADKLVEHPDRFDRIKNKLSGLDLPEVGKLARRQLVQHVEARERGPVGTTVLQDSLDRSYASQILWQ